jgi:hypothetical protein
VNSTARSSRACLRGVGHRLLNVRIILAVATMALLTFAAHAEGMGGKGKRHQQDAPKAQDQKQQKAAEDAYKNALKSIPVSNEKPDPWKTAR